MRTTIKAIISASRIKIETIRDQQTTRTREEINNTRIIKTMLIKKKVRMEQPLRRPKKSRLTRLRKASRPRAARSEGVAAVASLGLRVPLPNVPRQPKSRTTCGHSSRIATGGVFARPASNSSLSSSARCQRTSSVGSSASSLH